MAKGKEFKNMGVNENTGGLSALFESNHEEPKKIEKKQKNELTTRTFQYSEDDIEFLFRYSGFMGQSLGKRYSIRMALSDAVGLLKEKYAESMKK
jgi:hypothetical protein